MGKRGQLYILAVIVLAFVIYTLFTDTNIVKETIIADDFEQLASNYEIESAKFVNYLLSNNVDTPSQVEEYFKTFTGTFTAYSKTKNPDFGLLYLFHYKNKLYAGNYLEEDANIILEGGARADGIRGCLGVIPAGFRLQGATLYVGVGVDRIQDVLSQHPLCVRSLSAAGLSFVYDTTVEIEEITGGISSYEAEITQGKPDIFIVSRETKGNTRKVYTKGRFVHAMVLDDENGNLENAPGRQPDEDENE